MLPVHKTRIAGAAEPYRTGQFVREAMKTVIDSGTVGPSDLVSMSIEGVLARMSVAVNRERHGGSLKNIL